MATQQITLPDEVYATFSGNINAEAFQRIARAFDVAMNAKVKKVHMFFHSIGGFVGDGVAIFNYFRALPFELALYNSGVVSSIGAIAYLGAPIRNVSAHAVFMIHRTHINLPTGTTAARVQTLVNSAILDDKRTEAILKERLTLTADQWKHFDNDDLHFSADEAVKAGIAQQIADFAPPKGTQLYNI